VTVWTVRPEETPSASATICLVVLPASDHQTAPETAFSVVQRTVNAESRTEATCAYRTRPGGEPVSVAVAAGVADAKYPGITVVVQADDGVEVPSMPLIFTAMKEGVLRLFDVPLAPSPTCPTSLSPQQ
jgi:hypothetical protein